MFDQPLIEQRVMAAIQPQLDECDRLLDYYTEGLPYEVWGPISLQLEFPGVKPLTRHI